jgi:hypothetical protein
MPLLHLFDRDGNLRPASLPWAKVVSSSSSSSQSESSLIASLPQAGDPAATDNLRLSASAKQAFSC